MTAAAPETASATAGTDAKADDGLAEYVEKVLAGAPPLRDEDRDRIVCLLKGTA